MLLWGEFCSAYMPVECFLPFIIIYECFRCRYYFLWFYLSVHWLFSFFFYFLWSVPYSSRRNCNQITELSKHLFVYLCRYVENIKYSMKKKQVDNYNIISNYVQNSAIFITIALKIKIRHKHIYGIHISYVCSKSNESNLVRAINWN